MSLITVENYTKRVLPSSKADVRKQICELLEMMEKRKSFLELYSEVQHSEEKRITKHQLYLLIRKLSKEGYVAKLFSGDTRKSYYQLSPLGKRIVKLSC